MPYSVKGFFEINEDMVQILLMLEVLFTQDSKVEDLLCGASSGSGPSLFFSNYYFSLGFQPIQDDFQHDFARMTDEADRMRMIASLDDKALLNCILPLILCILLVCSTIICWTSPFVILGVSGLFCRFYSISTENPVSKQCRP